VLADWVFAEVGILVAIVVASVLVLVFETEVARATTPMHPRTTTANTPRTIQSQVLLLFFGGGICGGG